MAESTLKIGQIESTIQFDKTNAEVTELLESLMPDDWDKEGKTNKEALEEVHYRLWEVLIREIEGQRVARLRREERQKQRLEMAKVREEARLVKEKKTGQPKEK